MDNRIAVLSIIIYDREEAGRVNDILHEYGKYIIGRMGLPYDKKNVSVICVMLDAPTAITSAISGKLGMLKGVSAKTNTAKI